MREVENRIVNDETQIKRLKELMQDEVLQMYSLTGRGGKLSVYKSRVFSILHGTFALDSLT